MDVGVDAYVSVEEVSAYLTARGQQAAWTGASTSVKEAAIIEATSFLDAAFSWVGKLEDLEQTLGWPRVCATDREGRRLTGIPVAVKNATSELANLALNGRLMPMTVATSSGAVTRERIGDVETEYDHSVYVSAYGYVETILRGIGRLSGAGGSGMAKLVRT